MCFSSHPQNSAAPPRNGVYPGNQSGLLNPNEVVPGTLSPNYVAPPAVPPAPDVHPLFAMRENLRTQASDLKIALPTYG